MYTSGKASSSLVSMSRYHCTYVPTLAYVHTYHLRQPSEWHAAIFCAHGLAVRLLVLKRSSWLQILMTNLRLIYCIVIPCNDFK